MGDWQDRGEVAAAKASMPLHYSAARYTQSLRIKHRMLLLVSELTTFEAWEMVPEEVLKAADANKAVARDRHVVWSSPVTEEEAQTRFNLSEELTASAAARRAKGPAQGEEAMPAQLKNFLKNGARLCAAFNVHECQLGEDA